MNEQEFVLALSPDGSRIEIFQGPYGRGSSADTADGILTLERSSSAQERWFKGLAAAFFERALSEPAHSTDGRSDDAPYDPAAEGRHLFDLLLPSPLREKYRLSIESARRAEGRRVRVCLLLRPDPGHEHVHAIPWELLWDEELGDAVARHDRTPFVRTLRLPRAEERSVAEPPLRVLLMFPDSALQESRNLRRERREIEQRLDAVPVPIRIESVPTPVTPKALHLALLAFRPHVLHFGGHGVVGEQGEGSLIFDAAGPSSPIVPGSVFGEALKSCPDLGLVVLNACHSASATPRNAARPRVEPGMAVAEAVLAAGHLAVVAMQARIRGRAALDFSQCFYDRLAGGDPLDVAANLARNHLFVANPGSPEWATPVVYLRARDGRVLPPAGEAPRSDSAIRHSILDTATLVRAKTREFVGRGFVFDEIDRFLESDGGCLLIEGDPGIGKTTVLAELVRRRRPLHHFITWGSVTANKTEHALSNLAAQLILQFGLPYETLPPEAGRSSNFLVRLLEQALATSGGRQGILLLVDALDELEGAPHSLQRPLDFPRHLPPQVYFVLSKRRDKDVPLRFDEPVVPVPIHHGSEENLRDIETFIRRLLPRSGIVAYRHDRGFTETQFTTLLAERSEGNFMYLHHVMAEIEHGQYRHEDPYALPRGLEGYYRDHWQRLKTRSQNDDWFDVELPVLAAVTEVKEPVSVKFIADALGRKDYGRIASALESWSQFLHVTTEPGDPDLRLYRLYHGSFHDFVQKQDAVAAERVRLREMRRRIMNYVSDEFEKSRRSEAEGTE